MAPFLQIKEVGCGEYSIADTSMVRQLSLSPRSFGRPHSTLTRQDKGKEIVKYSYSCSFIRWGDLQEESLDKDVNQWLYREEDDMTIIRLPLDQYGSGFKML